MKRYFVCRHWFKWKGQMYYKGDLLPTTFTHHDKARSIYGSRIGMCEVDDISAPTPSGVGATAISGGSSLSSLPKAPASGVKSANTSTTGLRPLSGISSDKGVVSAAKNKQ